MSPARRGGRPRIGAADPRTGKTPQVTIALTPAILAGVEALATAAGVSKAVAIRAALDQALKGQVEIAGWVYGPPRADGHRYRCPKKDEE
jgi:hypothetical protein